MPVVKTLAPSGHFCRRSVSLEQRTEPLAPARMIDGDHIEWRTETALPPFKGDQLIKESWIFGRRRRMARKRFTAEQIIIKLREGEVSQSQGKTVGQECKQIGGDRADRLPVEEGVRGSEDGSGQASEVAGEGEWPAEEAGGGPVAGQPDFGGSLLGKLPGPAKRRGAVVWVRERFGPERVCERRACRVLGQARTTQRRVRQIPKEEAQRVIRMVELASQYGRYGYRRITAMLRLRGVEGEPQGVERLWRQEGLKVPTRQPKRRRLWAP